MKLLLTCSPFIDIQILLPAPFFFGNKELALDYFGSAFEFSRKFTYKESVNLAFLSKEVFDGDLVSTVLLGLHVSKAEILAE